MTQLFPFATPHFNAELDEFFENTIIATKVLSSRADKIAVCSWALRQKMTARIPPRRDLSAEVLLEDFDVMSFTKNSKDHDMLAFLEYHHPEARAILEKILKAIDLKVPEHTKFPIYQNAFCARREIYQDYVKKVLVPAIIVMKCDQEIRELCWQDAKYTVTTLGIPVDFIKIQKFLGVPYYPLHPFLLERLFSCYINDKNLKVIYL